MNAAKRMRDIHNGRSDAGATRKRRSRRTQLLGSSQPALADSAARLSVPD